ncbi:MAG TPA: hypothetical protein DHV63_00315 [Pseudomonas sp.]|nr:hypothetical protein [Pseudomonas sp.]
MPRPRRTPVWIAALAVLLHLFAMPLMGAGARVSGMAGHCPMVEASQHDARHVAMHVHALHGGHASHESESSPKPAPRHHLGMPCCCTAGSAALAAIPSSALELHEPRRVRLSVLPLAVAPRLSPRYRWPSLNPRASPVA